MRRSFVPESLQLEEKISLSVTVTTGVVKVPGPTDIVVTTATNPAGNNVPGQSDVEVLSNKDARHS